MSKKKKKRSGGGFGGGRKQIAAHSLPVRKADWEEIQEEAQRIALKQLSEEKPEGFLVKHGENFGWLFVDGSIPMIANVDAQGGVQLHATAGISAA